MTEKEMNIPENERWLHKPKAKADLERAFEIEKNRSIIKHIRPYKPHIWNRFCTCIRCGISSQAARDQQTETDGVGPCSELMINEN